MQTRRTSRLENFLQYDLGHRFYPMRRVLPHEPPQRLGLVYNIFDQAIKLEEVRDAGGCESSALAEALWRRGGEEEEEPRGGGAAC